MYSSWVRLTFIVIILLGSMLGCNKDVNKVGYNANVFWSAKHQRYSLLNRIIQEESLVTWASSQHTAQPVPMGAIGPKKYLSRFKGIIDITEIALTLKEAVTDGLNVILVIGDGMGVMHMTLPQYENIVLGNKEETSFGRIMKEGAMALCINHNYQHIVTDSASSATAMCAGVKTLTQVVGLDQEGNSIETVLDLATRLGRLTAVVTNTSITHATPAAFYAENISRYNENDIAEQLVFDNDIDIVMGGGIRHFIPVGTKPSDFKEFETLSESLDVISKRKDSTNLISVIKDKGYLLVTDKVALANLDNTPPKLFGLFAGSHQSYAIDRDEEETSDPSLDHMVDKTLSILELRKKPFFAMFEAGLIDHGSHDNDIGTVIKSMHEMNKMLEVCYGFYSKHPKKTLLLFIADHETGGMSFSYSKKKDFRFQSQLKSGLNWSANIDALPFERFRKLLHQKKSYEKMFSLAKTPSDLQKIFNANTEFSITVEEARELF